MFLANVHPSGMLLPDACVRAWFPTNQCLESALWLTNQIAQISPLICARKHFPLRLSAWRFTAWFGVSPISLSLDLPYSSELVTVSAYYLSHHRLPIISSGARLLIETTRGYCWKLVFLGR